VREENAGGGVEVIAGVAEGVLGGLFSRRIGLASKAAFYSAHRLLNAEVSTGQSTPKPT
jgi:hypothetical protein